jgi:hypothetical protein
VSLITLAATGAVLAGWSGIGANTAIPAPRQPNNHHSYNSLIIFETNMIHSNIDCLLRLSESK